MELSKIVNCLFWTTCQCTCIFSTGRAPAYGARAIVYCMVYIIFSRPAGQPHKLMIFTITPTCNRSYESHFRFSKQTHVLLQTVILRENRYSYVCVCVHVCVRDSIRDTSSTCCTRARAPALTVTFNVDDHFHLKMIVNINVTNYYSYFIIITVILSKKAV